MKTKPNILMLFTDQQRFDTIAAAGYSWMKTPNLDRLAKMGCVFTNAYSPNPVCIPARHNLITGLPARFHGYSANNAHPLDFRLPVLPRILSDNGYTTRAIGKMHFQPHRRHNGFDKMELMEEMPSFREEDEYAMYLKSVGLGNIINIHGIRNKYYMAPQRSIVPLEHHGSNWVGNRSVNFLKNHPVDKPFFLWSSWIAPHPPFDVPDEYADLYKHVNIPEPVQSETDVSRHTQGSQAYGNVPDRNSKDYVQRMRELYYSSITLVDYNIGKILDTLEQTGKMGNTLIIFTSDHGELLGDHGGFQKMEPYDSCSKIPFIIYYPENFDRGSFDDRLVNLNDILPTILDLTGLDYPGEQQLPGYSILDKDQNRKYQYMEYGADECRWISIRDKQFKFNYFYYNGFEELYDLVNDPQEKINLLLTDDAKNYDQTRDHLKTCLMDYELKWGLQGTVKDGDFIHYGCNDLIFGGPNKQFQIWPDRIVDPKDKGDLNNIEKEVLMATKKESKYYEASTI